MNLSISKKLALTFIALSAFCSICLTVLFGITVRGIEGKSEEYIRSTSQRYAERVSILIREKQKTIENLGERLRHKYEDYFRSEVHAEQHRQDIIELFAQYQYGMEYESLWLLNARRSPLLHYDHGFLAKSPREVPSYVIEAMRDIEVGDYRAIAGEGAQKDSFYLAYAPRYRNAELSDDRRDRAALADAARYIIVQYEYDIARRSIDEISYNEEKKNGIKWKVAFYRGADICWQLESGMPVRVSNVAETISYSRMGNDSYYFTLVTVPKANWSIGAAVARDPILSPLQKMYFYGILLLLASVGVVLYCLKYLNARIREPLKRLTSATKAIAGGCYDVHVESASSDELGVLARSFAEMAGRLKDYQEKIRESAAMAAIGRLSSQLAHDIRSPLSVLKGYVCAPRDDDAAMDDEEREFVGAARRSVEKLENMAGDLLDYARAHKIERTRTRLGDIVRETLREVSAEAEHHGVAVECRDEAGIVAMVDREKMGRVLTNIVLNAVQAHERPGFVSVKAAVSGRDLAIAVIDDGKGIHPENMSRIFESSFTFGKPRGTGLGLAYCKQVIEAHGGELSVESEPGKGSTFTIRIPGCIVTAAEAQGEEADVCAGRLEIGPEAGACNVMVVDDDADVLRQWRRIIDEKGGRLVYSAASVEEVLGAEALDFAAVDAAIVDYQYEGSPRNGIELIRLLKGKGVRQVHLCTGFHGDESIRREAMDAGADSVIPKPLATF